MMFDELKNMQKTDHFTFKFKSQNLRDLSSIYSVRFGQ